MVPQSDGLSSADSPSYSIDSFFGSSKGGLGVRPSLAYLVEQSMSRVYLPGKYAWLLQFKTRA